MQRATDNHIIYRPGGKKSRYAYPCVSGRIRIMFNHSTPGTTSSIAVLEKKTLTRATSAVNILLSIFNNDQPTTIYNSARAVTRNATGSCSCLIPLWMVDRLAIGCRPFTLELLLHLTQSRPCDMVFWYYIFTRCRLTECAGATAWGAHN